MVPLAAVPGRLRTQVAKILEEWGYGWADVSLAGTVEVPQADHRRLTSGAGEVWVFAITTAARLTIGDELESVAGRAASVGLSAYAGGVIPVTPYQALVYEFLGRRDGDGSPEAPAPPRIPLETLPPMAPGTEPAVPDPRG